MYAALIGQGLQMYGADQNKAAQERALAGYMEHIKRNQGFQDTQDAQLQAYLKQISGNYSQDVTNMVDQFDPAARVSAFNSGQAQQSQGIGQVLAAVNARNPVYAQQQDTGGTAGLFANAQAQEASRVATATQPVADASALSGGLTAMAARDRHVGNEFGDKARGYSTKIQDIMRLYALGNASRNQALERAALQHQQDQSRAQSAGNGAMLAGGLVTAGSQAYGAYQAGQAGQQNSAAQQAYNHSLSQPAPQPAPQPEPQII